MSIKPGNYDPIKPDIELFDYQSKKRYGLKLEGASALQVGTISQDDSVHVRDAGKRVGDFDEQRSWKARRGIENLSDNAEGFWDSKNAWTLTPGHLHQTLLWRPARGLKQCEFFLPDKTHSLTWKPLVGSYFSIAFSLTTTTTYFASERRLWIRKVGNPGTLRFTIQSDSGGNPGTVLETVDITASNVPDTLSQFYSFAGNVQIFAATTYHIVVHDQSGTDNNNNHWEIGVYNGGSTGKISTDGSSWSSSGFDLYYYAAANSGSRKFYSFFLDEAMFVVKVQDFKTTLNSSLVYINGDRGKLTSIVGNVFTDSSKAWLTNQWAGAWVKIIRGTGAGQTMEITSSTSNFLTVVLTNVVPPIAHTESPINGTEGGQF